MTAAQDEFEEILRNLHGTPWRVSRETISGVDTAVLVRRVQRSSGSTGGATSGTVFEKRATESGEKSSQTRQNDFRPKSPIGDFDQAKRLQAKIPYGSADWPGRNGQCLRAVARHPLDLVARA